MNYLELSGIQKKSTINTLAGHPLDARQCVDEYEDLFKKSTWTVENKTYIYNGMPVTVKETGKMYILKNFKSKSDYSIVKQYDGWTGEDDKWLRDVNWQELLIDEQRLISAETKEENGIKYLVLNQKTKLGIVVDPIKIPLSDISYIKTLGLFVEGNDYTDIGGTFNGRETKGISFKGVDSIEITSDIKDTINIGLSWKPISSEPASVTRTCSFGYIKPVPENKSTATADEQEQNTLNIYSNLGSVKDNGEYKLLRYSYTNSRLIDIPLQISGVDYSGKMNVPINTSSIIMPNIQNARLKSISIACTANNSANNEYVVEIYDCSTGIPKLLNRGYSSFKDPANPQGCVITETPGNIYTWYFREKTGVNTKDYLFKYGKPNLNMGTKGYMIKFTKMINKTFTNTDVNLYCDTNASSIDQTKILYNDQYKYVLPAIEIKLDNSNNNYAIFKYFEEIADMHNYGTELPNPKLGLPLDVLDDTYTVQIDVKNPGEESYTPGTPFIVNKSDILKDDYNLKVYSGYSYKIYVDRNYKDDYEDS